MPSMILSSMFVRILNRTGCISWDIILIIIAVIFGTLNSHLAPLVTQTIEVKNGLTQFISILRPPYQPKYSPSEYAICDLVSQLGKLSKREWTTASIQAEIMKIGPDLNSMNDTFDHCGYSINGVY